MKLVGAHRSENGDDVDVDQYGVASVQRLSCVCRVTRLTCTLDRYGRLGDADVSCV